MTSPDADSAASTTTSTTAASDARTREPSWPEVFRSLPRPMRITAYVAVGLGRVFRTSGAKVRWPHPQ